MTKDKYYLGTLCKRGHDHEGTGKSLREKRRGHCYVCKLADVVLWKERHPERAKKIKIESRKRHKEKNKERECEDTRRWRLNNLEKSRAISRRCQRNASANLTDGYVRKLLTVKSSLRRKDFPQDLVDAKREVIKLERTIKRGGKNEEYKRCTGRSL